MDTIATKFLDKEKNAEDPEWSARNVISGTETLVKQKISCIRKLLRVLQLELVSFEQSLWRFTEDCHNAKAC